MRKDPILACLLNLLLVGTGHIYLGQIWKGVIIFAIGIVLAMFVPIVAVPLVIWAMFDAYSTAKRMDQPEKKTSAE